jgi:tetratricopeptide (TPR) repeat protein
VAPTLKCIPGEGGQRATKETGYSAREVAALLDIPADKVRSFVQLRLLSPERGERGEYRFSFRDLVLLRALKGLVDAQIPARRLRRALRKLKAQVPAERPLSGIAITAEADRIIARDDRSQWNPESGQMAFDFPGRRAAPVGDAAQESPRATIAARDGLDADGWYKLGCEMEASAPDRACEAYCRAIELDERHADAHINLGRMLHHRSQVQAAEKHYRLAVLARPKDAVASFNLAIALEDLGRTDEAMLAYRDAIAADPACADAYFNLAHLYEQEGMRANAIRYLKTYRTLSRQSRP